ncbi:hypothetical protein [Streptomyces niger]|uniref:hypothetical protein n=1 Tax=Streptomyces niger TaxID=66373 RepID=UPI00069C29A1|nr:hypothetical protein [Streptomyces niger]
MPTLLHEAAGRLFISDNTFRLYDPDVMQHPEDDGDFDATATGLVALTASGPLIVCGTHLGQVEVTAQLWDRAPDLSGENSQDKHDKQDRRDWHDRRVWQDIAELTVPWSGNTLEIWGEGEPEIPLPLPGPGTYRLRVHARHRDAGEDRDENTPVETVLLQLWPTEGPHEPPLVHKADSTTGALWREDQKEEKEE